MTPCFWSVLLCCAVELLPFRLLAYYPFRKALRLPWPVVAGIAAALQILQAAFAFRSGGGSEAMRLLFSFVFLALYLACIREDPWKALFLYLFLFDYGMVVRGLAYVAAAFWRPEVNMTFPNLYSAAFAGLLFAATAFPAMYFLRRMQTRVLRTDAPALWHVIWLLPAFNTAIVMMYAREMTSENVRQPEFLITRLLLIAVMFLSYDVLLYALDMLRSQAALAERAAQQETMLAVQNTQYQQLTRHIQETAQASHDLRQQLRIVRGYLKEGRIRELEEYLGQYEQTLPPDVMEVFCRNHAVNTLVSYYAEEARKAEVDFSAQLRIPEHLCVSEPEVCAVFGNLLENALEACRHVTECAPFIRLRAEQEDGRIALVVDNTCLDSPEQVNGRFRSTKHGGYGTGTASVKRIAERWGGTAEFVHKGNVFYVSVLLFEQT